MLYRGCFAGLFLFAALAGTGWSQEFRGTLTGRVVDSSNAVIPGVRIIATQVDTGSNHETISGADGLYAIPYLSPGTYRISAEASGFKRYVREGVVLSTNERKALDVTLEVGQVIETVTVTAETTMLQTATASTGQTISARQIEYMPLLGRTPLVLAQLAFGVIPSSDPRFYRPFDNSGPSTFTMGGAPRRTNELLLDGSPDNTGDNRVAYNPPVDTVEEVKVETFQADAAYGHTGGGTVNLLSKSGTNALHGMVYEFNQVSRLAANLFFNNSAGLRKQVTRYNQWGLNAGGPVIIPKLIDGRNKVFFFFSYEGVKDSIPNSIITTVPTAIERSGDFSQLLTVGNNYLIYDPRRGVREGTRIRRQPFENNRIPPNLISGIAKNYLEQFYPLPNLAGLRDGQDNFISVTDGEINNFFNTLGRLDFNLSDRHKFFYNFRHNIRTGMGGNRVGRPLGDVTGTNGLSRINWGTMFDDVYTFTPTTVLNTRLNWTRFIEPNRNFSQGFDMTKLGFPASLAAASPRAVLPQLDFDRFQDLGDNGGREFPFDSFQIFVGLTKIQGNHSLKVGTDMRLYRESRFDLGFSSGRYQFRTQWNRGPLDNSPSAPLGQDLAAFLLGLPTGGSFDLNAARTNQAGYYALFLHDDFRIRPSLTLNLGIRYERDLPTTERYNRSVNGFDFTSPNPITAAATAAYARNPIPQIPVGQFRTPGGLQFAAPGNREIYETRSHYFSPRLGFAWNPRGWGGGTTIRGGVGIFFFALGTTGINQPGFSQSTPLVASLDGFLTPAATLSNPFPNGIQQPTGASLGLETFLGRGVTYYNPRPLNPYSTRWMLDIQRELTRNLVFEIGYMGNHAVHLDVDRPWNFLPRQYLSTSPTRDQATIDFLSDQVLNPFAGLIPGTGLDSSRVSRAQLLLPFPHFTGVSAQDLNDGGSFFHMLQVRVERRFAAGYSFLANYQYSKLLEKRSRLNDSDPFLEKRIADEDRPQRFVFSGSYELPFGRGKAFGGSAGPVVSRLIGGWVINAIYTIQPGAPLGWGNLIYYGGDLKLEPRRVDGAFDTTRFNTNSREQLGSNIRAFPTRFANLRQDGVHNIDFSVIKDTTIREKMKLQYRCEFFNGFNHPAFDPPERSATSTNFGKVLRQANLPRRIQMALRVIW